jgi:hypothetical protein
MKFVPFDCDDRGRPAFRCIAGPLAAAMQGVA